MKLAFNQSPHVKMDRFPSCVGDIAFLVFCHMFSDCQLLLVFQLQLIGYEFNNVVVYTVRCLTWAVPSYWLSTGVNKELLKVPGEVMHPYWIPVHGSWITN